MATMTMAYKGRDSWSRPVYECNGRLYVDVDPRKGSRFIHPCTKQGNDFDGEPDYPVPEDTEIIFQPCRDTWDF